MLTTQQVKDFCSRYWRGEFDQEPFCEAFLAEHDLPQRVEILMCKGEYQTLAMAAHLRMIPEVCCP